MKPDPGNVASEPPVSPHQRHFSSPGGTKTRFTSKKLSNLPLLPEVCFTLFLSL